MLTCCTGTAVVMIIILITTYKLLLRYIYIVHCDRNLNNIMISRRILKTMKFRDIILCYILFRCNSCKLLFVFAGTEEKISGELKSNVLVFFSPCTRIHIIIITGKTDTTPRHNLTGNKSNCTLTVFHQVYYELYIVRAYTRAL